MTTRLRRACERERAESMEPIRPIVRRVVERVGEQYPVLLADPVILSLYGEVVEP